MISIFKKLKLWRWQAGRQHSGYDKMLLAGCYYPIPYDVFLLRYPQGSFIKPHKDPLTKGKHYRINIVIKHAKQGGRFICDDTILNTKRVKIFRSDKALHSVSAIEKGTRYVLSIGLVLK